MMNRSLYRTAGSVRSFQAVRPGFALTPLAGARNFHSSKFRASPSSEGQQQQQQSEEGEFPEGDWAHTRPSGGKYWFTVLSAYGILGMTLGWGANSLFLNTVDGRIAPLVSMEELQGLDKEEREKYQAYKMELLDQYAREDRQAIEEKLAAKAQDRQARRARLRAQGHPLVSGEAAAQH